MEVDETPGDPVLFRIGGGRAEVAGDTVFLFGAVLDECLERDVGVVLAAFL
jgi:hypothetical protein